MHCTRHALYLPCTVLAMHCTHHALYSPCTVLAMHCTRHALYSPCTVFAMHCTHHALYSPCTVLAMHCKRHGQGHARSDGQGGYDYVTMGGGMALSAAALKARNECRYCTRHALYSPCTVLAVYCTRHILYLP
jgi:hypothetical protein